MPAIVYSEVFPNWAGVSLEIVETMLKHRSTPTLGTQLMGKAEL